MEKDLEKLTREELIAMITAQTATKKKKQKNVAPEKQRVYRMIRLQTKVPVPRDFQWPTENDHFEDEKFDRRMEIGGDWTEAERSAYLGTLEVWMGEVDKESYRKRKWNRGSVKLMLKAWVHSMENPANQNYFIGNHGKHLWRITRMIERVKKCQDDPWRDVHSWELCDGDSVDFFWKIRQDIWEGYKDWLYCNFRGRGLSHILESRGQHCFWPRDFIVRQYCKHIAPLVRPMKKLSKKVVMP